MNAAIDVSMVQLLLARHKRWLMPLRLPTPSGLCDAPTISCIEAFQERVAVLATPDGVVSPSGYTFRALSRPVVVEPVHEIFNPNSWQHEDGGLTPDDFAAAATRLGCEAAALKAVARIETRRSPWDKQGRPAILFERHKFSAHSQRAFDRSHPDLSSPNGYDNQSANPRDRYGPYGAQYGKLWRAAMLHEEAALKSASWGTFQILGENFEECGFKSIGAFVSAMMKSQQDHLRAVVAFIESSTRRLTALRQKDWPTFARYYNGPGYARHDYHGRIKGHYDQIVSEEASVRTPRTGP
jgi:hypothetical protein